MAQLKSTVVQGSLRVTDTTYTTNLNLSGATAWGVIYADNDKNIINTNAGTAGYLLQGSGAAAPSWIQATNSNIASTIVKRDSSGNFSAGTITAALTGNASSATKWASAQTVYVALGTASKTTTIQGGNDNAVTLGIDGTLAIGHGGTGKTTATEAWTALGGKASGKHEDSFFVAAITSTDNNIPRFNSTGGQLQSSRISINDNGLITVSYNGQYPGDTQYSNAAGQVGEFWLDTGHATNVTSPRFYWRVRRPKATAATTTESNYEQFRLPAATAGTADSATYEILTTKSTITVAQGGTGIAIIDPHKILVGPASGTTAAAPTWRTLNYQDSHGIEYIRGTWTAASGTWTGTTTDSELYDGKQIILYMPFAGSGNATLNLTLASGQTTGAKNVYFENTTRFTTHKGQNSQLHLIYHKALTLSNGTTYEGWWYVANRDTDNDYRARQNLLADTDTADRSLLLSNPANGTANNNTAYVSYRNNQFYVNASTGTLFSPSASFTDTTPSTSTSTGAVKIAGGLGVVGQVTATRIGVGGSNTGYTLYANGTTFLNGKVFSGTSNYGAALPTSGQTGQIFFQINNDTYELPLEGNAGQFLIKNANNARDVVWGNTISSLIVTGTIVTHGTITAQKVFNAVWNDYAECRNSWIEEPGRVIVESKSGTMELATERLMAGCKIISDTYGNLMGQSKTARTPIAVAGRVLAYPYQAREKYELGAAVCSGPNGTVDIMTREEIKEYPERILGTVSEIPDYDVWHAGNEQNPTSIQVNGRIWIYVR